MACVGNIVESAPAVGNLLILGERVGDEGKQPDILAESFCKRLRGSFALHTVFVLQQTERRLDRKLLAADLESEARDRLVEQSVPGRIAADRFFLEQLLDAVFDLMGLFLAYMLYPGA